MDPDHSQNIVLLITNKVQLKSSSLKSSSLFSRLSGNSWKCCFLIFFIKQSIIRVSWFIIPTYGVEWKNIQTFHFLTFWGRNKIQGLHGHVSLTVIQTPKMSSNHDPARRVRVERPNVHLIGISSLKALSCRVSCSGVLTIWPLPLSRLGKSIWLDDFRFPFSGNSMMS